MKRFAIFFLVLGIVTFNIGCSDDDDGGCNAGAFVGTYSVVETCGNSGNFDYNMTITESSSGDCEVLMANFGEFGSSTIVRGQVDGNNITLENQTVSAGGNAFTISNGSGSLNGNTISINYTFAIGGQSDNCTFNGSKQ